MYFGLIIIIYVGNIVGQEMTSYFNSELLKATVSIEIKVKNTYRPVGTGFILGTNNKHLILVTAKHIIINENNELINNLYYRLNEIDSNSAVFKTNYPPKYKQNNGWFISDKYDLALRFISFYADKSEFTYMDSSFFLDSKYLSPTTDVIILGYPMGLRAEKYSTPIVRKGIIAKNDKGNIILDAFIFPGNSGGPVLYTPKIKIGEGLSSKIINEEKLIGMVSSYIPYMDVAISQQTKRPRISFEENSGLCNIVPVDAIREIMNREDFIEVDNNLYKYRDN